MSMTERPPHNPSTLRAAFRNLSIGAKLNIGFGVLMFVLLLIIALIFSASERATAIIDLTEDVRVPSALASAKAQSSLLRMQAAVRGYLVLGNLQSIDDYNKARESFEINLALLQKLSANWTNPEDVDRLNRLVAIFGEWAPFPERLFKLHDSPLENRPALRIEDTEVRPLAGQILGILDQLIEGQEARAPSATNRSLLSHMLDFRNSFQAMITNLRAYAITGDLAFKFGYADNLVANSASLTDLEAEKSMLLDDQLALLTEIVRLRGQLLGLPELIFTAAESDRSYEDLYLFTTQVSPQAEGMLALLTQIADEQQRLLQTDLNAGRQRLEGSLIQTVLGGVLSLVLGLAMIYIFRRSIAGPVRRLNAAARRIGGGDLDFQVPVESGDEIGRLAVTFNSMTQQLRETIRNLDHARDAAESANQAKSDFLARMSHDLRTPLNAILGYAQILGRDDSLSPAQGNAVRTIHQSGDHLLTLISDILDLSRIEAQRLDLYPADFDLALFLDSIVEIFRIRIQDKPDVTLSYAPVQPLPATIHADEKRLRQVLINLIENAIKFTDQGKVTFGVAAQAQDAPASDAMGLIFQIQDTGIGMSAEELDRVFRPFEQAVDATLRTQGTGLGLAISKNLVQAMQGQLDVVSAPGRGSTFTVTLTLPATAAVPFSTPQDGMQTETTTVAKTDPPQAERLDGGLSPLSGPFSAAQAGHMLDLAWKGELPALARYVQELAQTDSRHRALAEQIQEMVADFDEDGLLALLEEAVPEADSSVME